MKNDSFHHGNLKAALIAAGAAQVDGEGADAVSLRDLARQVGVSAPAAYRHFADKDALLQAIAAAGFQDLAVQFGAIAGPDPRERLLQLGLAYLRFAEARPGMFRLMFWQALPPPLGTAGPSAYDTLVAAIAAIAPPTGDATQDAATVLRFWALAHGLAMLRLAGRITAVAPDERFLRFVLQPVVAGL